MAHNGEIRNFGSHRAKLLAEIAPRFRRFVLGDTDSEVIFFLFLTRLSQLGSLANRFGIVEVMDTLGTTVRDIRRMCSGENADDLLTIMLTDGTTMAGIHGGRELFWSTYKRRCADRDTCASFAPECEAPTKTGTVNHLIMSSEPLSGENLWTEMQRGDMVGVDWRMRLTRVTGDPRKLPIVA
jgi:glutamine amidotransferase